MAWFGLSLLGISDPIKDNMRLDYIEPTVPKDLLQMYLESGQEGQFSSYIRVIDVYLGQADGYAYGSYDRLIKMRAKGQFKPVGPVDMYKRPACTSMDIGWNLHDPALNGETWFKTFNKYS